MDDKRINGLRYFLKDLVRLTVDFRQTDQSRGISPPPIEKPWPPDGQRIDLAPPEQWRHIRSVDLTAAIGGRQSHRVFTSAPMSLEDLAFLLWATQGIRQWVNAGTALRTVPSAGCRHAFETYLNVLNVADLEPGLYRYLPVEHQLLLEYTDPDLRRNIEEAVYGQRFVGKAAVAFIWTTIPYRMEWRYGEAAHKVIALDAGHVCQNLYLGASAVQAGVCAIAAYHQELMDRFLRVDGEEEFAIYLAAVGKI